MVEITRKIISEAKVEHKNGLLTPFRERFDIIIGTPYRWPTAEEVKDLVEEVGFAEVGVCLDLNDASQVL